MLILIWRYSRALIHYELEYLLYNCTHETIDNMADITKIQSLSDLSYGLSLGNTISLSFFLSKFCVEFLIKKLMINKYLNLKISCFDGLANIDTSAQELEVIFPDLKKEINARNRESHR